jgi:hypothetical protein
MYKHLWPSFEAKKEEGSNPGRLPPPLDPHLGNKMNDMLEQQNEFTKVILLHNKTVLQYSWQKMQD